MTKLVPGNAEIFKKYQRPAWTVHWKTIDSRLTSLVRRVWFLL